MDRYPPCSSIHTWIAQCFHCIFFMSEGLVVAVVSCLEVSPCAPDVNFLRAVVGGDIALIDDSFVLAVFFCKWAHSG